MTFFGWVGGHHLMMMVIPRKEWLASYRHKRRLLQISLFLVFCVCLNSLTNTPRKTSGHGWTLVNVGFTMAIAILGEKWVRGEK